MRISKRKQFFYCFISFFFLAVPFKVMVLLEGFTEIRPVNAIPPIAGLMFGPIGAIACGIGNLFADFFGKIDASSILGIIINFIGAYLPYRLWHLFSKEAPNLHTTKNIFLYCFICLLYALTVAWSLAFGLYTFFDVWLDTLYTFVFLNNLGFSIGLGMPVLIILTSDDVNIKCITKPKQRNPTMTKWICLVYSLLMVVIFIAVFFFDLQPSTTGWLEIISIFSAIGLGFLLLR